MKHKKQNLSYLLFQFSTISFFYIKLTPVNIMLTKIPSKILKNTRGNFILSNIALKCDVIALKKNSLHASPNHPRGRQTFLFALCSYRKLLPKELTSQTEAHISKGNPEAAGLNVKMPRASKISQPIGVNESISYRLQISKHNRSQRG